MITKAQIEVLKKLLESYEANGNGVFGTDILSLGICNRIRKFGGRTDDYPEMQTEINTLIIERQKREPYMRYAFDMLKSSAVLKINYADRINFLKKWIEFYEKQLKPKRKVK